VNAIKLDCERTGRCKAGVQKGYMPWSWLKREGYANSEAVHAVGVRVNNRRLVFTAVGKRRTEDI
jgi:hypothetical protein